MLNPPDRNVIEIALNADTKTRVFCIGQDDSEAVLRESLAFGIDDTYQIEKTQENRVRWKTRRVGNGKKVLRIVPRTIGRSK